ncbi:hypothetical protein vseg_012689 [Gypsophila vaccaria]
MANQQQQTISSITTNDELCNWELVNQSDGFSDVDSNFDVHSFDDVVFDLPEPEPKPDLIDRVDPTRYADNHQGHFGNFGTHVVVSHLVDDDQGHFGHFTAHHSVDVNLDDVVNDDEVEDDDDDVEDDDDDDDDDVDDDLVPWEMKGIYMKERMKKCEKKYLNNMCKSRKLFRTVPARYAKAY